jgi:hypothetical protein
MTKDNSDQWLEMAKTLPKHQLEKEVARVSPKEATLEKAKYVSEERINLNMGLSEKSMKKFRRAQDLESQKKRRHASLEDSLDAVLDFYLERNDPIEKAKRNAKTQSPPQEVSCTKATVPGHSNLQKLSAEQGQSIQII